MEKQERYFLSCDWGTSSCRLRLVDTFQQNVVAEVADLEGISGTHSRWLEAQAEQGIDRLPYYLNKLGDRVRILSKKASMDLSGFPIVLSGMASSSIGMMELPHKTLPFRVDGSDLHAVVVSAVQGFPHACLLVSGACSTRDVMRGEEIQMVGTAHLQELENRKGTSVFLFPGTHSKHMVLEGNEIVDFKTYMTGELFQLMSEKSILSNSVKVGGNWHQPLMQERFSEGVRLGLKENLLESLFVPRINQLFGRCSPQENYFFLSGLIIGAEVAGLLHQGTWRQATLVAGKSLRAYYVKALQIAGLWDLILVDVDQALLAGHRLLFEEYFTPASDRFNSYTPGGF